MYNTNTTTSGLNQTCSWCGKSVSGGTYISRVFYCPMCASIINKNNSLKCKDLNESDLNINSFGNSVCENCPKNPKNGGDGICHCILGLPKITW